MNFSEIANSIGGFLILCYFVWQVIVKLCNDKDWFQRRRKERQKVQEDLARDNLKLAVKEVVEPMLDDIKQHNTEQDRKLNCLIHSSNDMLRAEIVKIYYRYLPYKKMLQYSRELLEKLYHDYADQGGNSFIEGIYNEMKTWPVVNTEQDLKN